jgi:hypothetical protein
MGAVPVRCDDCGAKYRAFRSGLDFGTVRIELRSEIHRTRVTRHTVLGRMHEHKIMRWGMEHGVGRCVPDPDAPAQPITASRSDEDWFAEGSQVMPTPTLDTAFPPSDAPDPVVAPIADTPARKPRKPRKPRAPKPSIVEAIAIAHECATSAAAPVGVIVAAPVFRAMRGYWCACGKRAHAAIGAPTPACAHRRAA